MNISDFMAKLAIEKTKDASYSYTGRPDFEAEQRDIAELGPRVKAPRAVTKEQQIKSQNNSY